MDDNEYFLCELAKKLEPLDSSISQRLRAIATQWHNRLETGVRHSQNSVTFPAAVFREADGSIHLTSPVLEDFHVAINEDASKRNGHPTLYRRLDNLLSR